MFIPPKFVILAIDSEYHIIEKVLRPQGLVDDMVIFVVDNDINKNLAIDLLLQNLFNLD